MRRSSLLAAVLCVLVVSSAYGQGKGDDTKDSKTAGLPFHVQWQETPLECVAEPEPGETKVDAAAFLVKRFSDWRQWGKLQKTLASMLASCTSKDTNNNVESAAITPTIEKPVLVTFIHENTAYSVVVPQEARYGHNLRGVSAVQMVVLMSPEDSRRQPVLDITLISTPVDNPLVSQIPAFVKTLVDGIGSGAQFNTESVTSSAPSGAQTKSLEIVAYVPGLDGSTRDIPLPFTRGTIVESGAVTFKTPDPPRNGPVNEKKEDKAAVSATYINAKPQHLEMGAVAGVFMRSMAGHTQMKVDNGKYAEDPMKRAMTMAVLSYRFAPVDPDGAARTEGQRWSMFSGGVLTPAPGFGVGLSHSIVKNLAVNIGGAMVWVKSAPKDENDRDLEPGDAAITGDDQLVHRWAAGWFIGGTYAFGGK
jgi:hypothetical protein